MQPVSQKISPLARVKAFFHNLVRIIAVQPKGLLVVGVLLAVVAAFVLGALQLSDFSLKPKKTTVAAVSPIISVKDETGVAEQTVPADTLKWQKQIELTPATAEATAEVFEKILPGQDYKVGSLQLPPGWKAQWSTSQVSDPAQATYSDTEPGSGVTFVRIYTDKVTTTQPVSQAGLTQPLDQSAIASPSGALTVAAVEFNDKVFTIYRSVDVSDGVNDSQNMTIGCLDLTTYETCTGAGVTYPTYMSSSSGTLLGEAGSPKDISTPMALKYALDDGAYGNEGRLYIPAQKANEYGVNCVDLATEQNCGFTAFGSSAAPNQSTDRNPSRITGFAQSGSKLYGHATTNDGDGVVNDDYMQITCFDMQTDAQCAGYTGAVNSVIPSYYINEHYNEFYTPGQNIVEGDKYYFLLNYDQGNQWINNLQGQNYTQTLFGNRLVCYDVSTQATCTGWPTANPEYRACVWEVGYYGFQCYQRQQTVYGSFISEDIAQAIAPNQLFLAKDNQGNTTAICVVAGLYNGVDPGVICRDKSTGAPLQGAVPPGFMPLQWLNIPWSPGFASTQLTDNSTNTDRLYSSFRLPANSIWGGRQKAALVCYDWKTQAPCDGFRYPHYWYEIDQADSADVGYFQDHNCMIGVSEYNYLWSFDRDTGETPCRKTTNQVDIKPALSTPSAFCDGLSRNNLSWAKLQLNSVNLYDFEYVDITIKGKNGVVVGSFNEVNIKDIESIDLSGVPYSGNTDELQVEVKTTVWNTTPWAENAGPNEDQRNLPLVTVVLNGDPAQYCYQTIVDDRCNIESVSTLSDITITSEGTTNELTENTSQEVYQEPAEKCVRKLNLSSSANKSTVTANELVTYTVDVGNEANPDPQSLGDVADARIETTIPGGATLESATGGYTVEGNKIIWANETIEALGTTQKTITVRIPTLASRSPLPWLIGRAEAAGPLAFQTSVFYTDSTEAQATTTSSVVVNYVAPSAPPPTSTITPSTTPTPSETPTPSPSESPSESPSPEASVSQSTPPSSGPSGGSGGGATRRSVEPENTSSTFLSEILPESVVSQIRLVPENTARTVPFVLITILFFIAVFYARQAWLELRNMQRLDVIVKRYQATQEANKNFVALTSHYLNTPVNILQASTELLKSQKTVSEETLSKLKLAVDNLAQDVKDLVSGSQEFSQHVAQSNAEVSKLNMGRLMRNLHVLIPIGVAALTLAIVNLLFTQTDRYDLSGLMLLGQSLAFILAILGIVGAYRSYLRNRATKDTIQHQIKLEGDLLKRREEFIIKSYDQLNADFGFVQQYGSEIPAKSPSKKTFDNGLAMLSAVLSKFHALINFSKPLEKLPAAISVAPAFEKALRDLKPQIDAKQLTVKNNIPANLTVSLTTDALTQLTMSVIDNAVKFSKQNGSIQISTSQRSGKIMLHIKDDGIGIPKAKLDQLMTPFSRATDVLKFDYEGIGLNLYLNKVVTEQYGGSIKLRSNQGKGTEVTITLPAHQ